MKIKSRSKKIIIGNWKMAPNKMKEAKAMFTSVKKTASTLRGVSTILCPPFVYLSELRKLVGGHRCVIGAQNSSHSDEEAQTGEISSKMLKDVGVLYVIVGHSERRAMMETDEIISKKVRMCLKEGLKVVLCVGEKERDEHGEFTKFIIKQIEDSLLGVNKSLIKDNLIIAYEPLWAIGEKAKATPTPEDFLEVSILIKKTLADMFGRDIAMNTLVLYGGSVNPENAEGFLSDGEADGLLVGRASLYSIKFNKILEIANSIK